MPVRIEVSEHSEVTGSLTADGVYWPDGAGIPSYSNARAALLALMFEFDYDVRARRAYITRIVKKKRKRCKITEKSLYSLRQSIIDAFGFDPKKEHTADAVMQLAYEHSCDPVVKYTNSLQWDGTERVPTWLTDYLGVEDTAFTRAIGQIVLVAAVRRARRPGCKFDEILVLIGEQGSYKSTAVRILAKKASWFSDQEVLHLNAQQQQEALDGIWIYELSELGGLGRATAERAKAFASRSADRARRAYGRFREDAPRRCIFIATTNDDRFLRDLSGNRRFWPVAVGKIRIKALKRDIDQLWAEAAVMEGGGENIRLPKRFWPDAARAQERRMEIDPWVAILSDLVGEKHGDELRISYADVFVKLGIPGPRLTSEDLKRLAFAMERNGWRRKERPFKHRGRPCRGFYKPATENISSERNHVTA